VRDDSCVLRSRSCTRSLRPEPPVIGLEPSCLAVWRSDAAELLPHDSRVREVAAGVLTLAELLQRTPQWAPPDLSGLEVVFSRIATTLR
jgi:hypothetical protein